MPMEPNMPELSRKDPFMKKLLRRLLIVVLILLVAAVAVPLFVRQRIYSKPAWYPKARLNTLEQAAASNRADQKLIQARSEIAAAYAAQVRASRAASGPTTLPLGEFSIALTEDEINSWVPKWSDELGWSQRVDKYVTEPQIVFDEHEIILAATVKDWKTIVSLHFLPQLQEQKLRLTLTNVMAGTLPLPKVAWSSYEQRLLNALQSRLPEFQKEASIDASGRANSAAVSAAMSELLVHTLNDEPAEPVLFLPEQFSKTPRSLPVKITEVTVADKTLTLTVQPMDASQRTALLQHLRGSTDSATAMSDHDGAAVR